MTYVEIVIGNRNFHAGKEVIVKVPDTFTFITSYRDEAFKIACEKLNLNQAECCVLDWRYFGHDVTFLI
jgi:hypothetical protein